MKDTWMIIKVLYKVIRYGGGQDAAISKMSLNICFSQLRYIWSSVSISCKAFLF